MSDAEALPERLEATAYEAWGEAAVPLERDLPLVTDPSERWLQLILLTNVLHSQYEIVSAQIGAANEELGRVSGRNDPDLPGIKRFIGRAGTWIEEFKQRFDRHQDERDRLAGELTEALEAMAAD
jgi:hypothetical protein